VCSMVGFFGFVNFFCFNAQRSFPVSSILYNFCIFVPTQDKVIRDNSMPNFKGKIQLCSLVWPQVDRKDWKPTKKGFKRVETRGFSA